jgi:protein-S-isoprenylcysteine O-methyltransferase Ste14
MSAPPPSATDYRATLTGLAAMLAATGFVLWTRLDERWGVPLLMAVAALPILLIDVAVNRVHRRPTTGLDWAHPVPRDWRRIGTRWLGAIGGLAPVLVVYGLTPEYQGDYYDRFWHFLHWFGPLALALGAVYFAWLDRYLVDPRDTYWHLGAFLTGRSDWEGEKIGQLLRSWAIKGFFVPLMYIYASKNLVDLRTVVWSDRETFLYVFDGLWHAGFLIDVVFTTMGYLATFRLFDTHVRSSEPTTTGWVAALVCYQPFFSLIFRQYLMYEGGYMWGDWLAGSPARIPWGAAILSLNAVFYLSTVMFGCRFSNLTHRGIVTIGPYRWTRHPAYVSKIASYWLINVPFLYRGSLRDTVAETAALCGLAVVYWLRARTEERHLSRDPAYVTYAVWMNERSIFAPLGRWLPFLVYRPP